MVQPSCIAKHPPEHFVTPAFVALDGSAPPPPPPAPVVTACLGMPSTLCAATEGDVALAGLCEQLPSASTGQPVSSIVPPPMRVGGLRGGSGSSDARAGITVWAALQLGRPSRDSTMDYTRVVGVEEGLNDGADRGHLAGMYLGQ